MVHDITTTVEDRWGDLVEALEECDTYEAERALVSILMDVTSWIERQEDVDERAERALSDLEAALESAAVVVDDLMAAAEEAREDGSVDALRYECELALRELTTTGRSIPELLEAAVDAVG